MVRGKRPVDGSRRAFFFGLLTGSATFLVLMGLAGAIVLKRGVTVRVPTAPVAAAVAAEVRHDSYQQLPSAIAELQRTLPARLSGAIFPRLGSGTQIRLGGIGLTLSPGMSHALRLEIAAAFEKAVAGYLAHVDRRRISTYIGRAAARLVEGEIRRNFQGRRVIVQPWPWLRVPVRLEFS